MARRRRSICGRPPCGGGATDGDWVIGWGGTDNVTEEVGGVRNLLLQFPGTPIIYRAIPLTDGQVTIDQLRAAMDARAATASTQGRASVEPGGPTPFPP